MLFAGETTGGRTQNVRIALHDRFVLFLRDLVNSQIKAPGERDLMPRFHGLPAGFGDRTAHEKGSRLDPNHFQVSRERDFVFVEIKLFEQRIQIHAGGQRAGRLHRLAYGILVLIGKITQLRFLVGLEEKGLIGRGKNSFLLGRNKIDPTGQDREFRTFGKEWILKMVPRMPAVRQRGRDLEAR